MPPDRCPYGRPFPEGFDACPAFTAAAYTALDFHFPPTTPVHTCARLTIGEEPSRTGAYYPRCALGTAEQRQAWARRI